MTNSFLPANTLNAVSQVVNNRVPYVLDYTENPSGQDMGDVRAFLWARTGHWYYKLQAGNTRPVDGTRIVADRNGAKFAISNNDFPKAHSGVRKSPPSRNASGVTYRVDPIPSGAWASRANTIAVYNAELGEFIFYGSEPGDIILNTATNSMEFHDNTSWQSHLGADNIGAGDISPIQLSDPGFLAVRGYQDTPPQAVSAGDLFVVRNGSGVWNGLNNRIVWRDTAGNWLSRVPKQGMTIKTPTETRTYNGTTWKTTGSELANIAFKRNDITIGNMNPSGDLLRNQKRVLWQYIADSDVDHLEVITRDIDIAGEFSMRIVNRARAGAEMDFVIDVGGTPVTTVEFNRYRNEQSAVYGVDGKFELSDITPEIPDVYIDFGSYSSRTVTFSMNTGTRGSDTTRVYESTDIRNPTAAAGFSIIRGYKEV